MAQYPWDYLWSSARWHVRMPVKKFIKVGETALIDKKYWKKYLLSTEQELDDRIRRLTQAWTTKKEIGRCPLVLRMLDERNI